MSTASGSGTGVSPQDPKTEHQASGTGKESKPVAVPAIAIVRQEQNLEKHYNELLKLIGEIGRDIKPAYTNSKMSADRLRKNIMIARGVLRECLGDLDKLYGSTNDHPK